MSAPEERPSTAPPAMEDEEEQPSGGPKKLVERLLKKGIESGFGVVSKSEDTVRGVIEGLKIPKEMMTLALEQVDDTKNGLYRAVAKEMRDFLQSTNFASELKSVLTGLAFEVKMEVRFKNVSDESGKTTVRPDVEAEVGIKDKKPKKE